MAKLTDRQKNNIKAKWSTGQYTKTQLAKTYKVDEKVIRNVVGKEEPTNAHLVEASLMIEGAKKGLKSPIEVREIDNAVKYRLEKEYADDNKRVRVYDTSFEILETINGILKKGTIQEKINKGDGVQDFEPRSINADDALKMANAVDKISQTTNVNTPQSQVQVNNQNNNDNSTKEITYKVVS